MLLQIHDELLFEIQDDKIEEIYPKIKDIMESAYKITVPLKVDVSVGPSWGELSRVT
jgi:DNA polymerase-1